MRNHVGAYFAQGTESGVCSILTCLTSGGDRSSDWILLHCMYKNIALNVEYYSLIFPMHTQV